MRDRNQQNWRRIADAAACLLIARDRGASRVELTRRSTVHNEHEVTLAAQPPGLQPPADVLYGLGPNGRRRSERESIPLGQWSPGVRGRDCTVEWGDNDGNGWRLQFNTMKWLKRPLDHVDRGDGFKPGLRVTWQLEGKAAEVDDDLLAAALHIGIPVSLNGDTVRPEEFLTGHVHRTDRCGASITIMREQAQTEPDRLALTEISTQVAERYRGSFLMDGMPVHGPATAGAARGLVNRWNGEIWHVRAQLDRDQKLRWRPGSGATDRSNEPYRNELQRCARQALYKELAKAEPPVQLPYKDWLEAQLLGVPVEETTPALERWTAPDRTTASYSTRQRGQREEMPARAENWIVDAGNADHADLHVLAEAAAAAGARLWRPDALLEGYGWYDALPVAQEVDVTSVIDNERTSLTERREKLAGITTKKVDRIHVTVTLQASDGVPWEKTLDATMAYSDAATGDLPVAAHYTEAARQASEETLVAKIRDAGAPELIEEEDGDCEDLQAIEDVRIAAEAIAIAIHGDREEDHERLLQRRIKERLRGALKPGQRIEARCGENGELAITVG